MGAGRVNAGSEFSTGGGCKGGNHFIAVVVGRFHPPDGGDGAVFAHKGPHFFFFLLELFGVVQPQKGQPPQFLARSYRKRPFTGGLQDEDHGF